MTVESIVISNLESLLHQMEQADFGVEWTVRCQFGPDWVTGGRWIQFYLGGKPLAKTLLHQELKTSLVQALSIPEMSPDAVINGEGEINHTDNRLVIDYDWWESVPYMYPRDSGAGTAVLIEDVLAALGSSLEKG